MTQQNGPKSEILGRFSEMLKVPGNTIDCDMHVLELGADSIMLIEAQRWLKARFGLVVEVPQFFEELNTINRIAAFIEAEAEAGSDRQAVLQTGHHQADRPSAGEPWHEVQGELSLLRSQLVLVADVIEAQNRLLQDRRG